VNNIDKIREAEARIRELEDKLNTEIAEHTREVLRNGVLEAQLADMRDLAYNRAPKLAAEECNKQKAELEARLAEAEKRWEVADEERTTAQHWDGKWEAVKPLCQELGIDEPDARLELSPCAACGESGFIVSWDGKHKGRPTRIGRCKKYKHVKTQGHEVICGTEIHPTAEDAAAEWERDIARQSGSGDATRGASERGRGGVTFAELCERHKFTKEEKRAAFMFLIAMRLMRLWEMWND